MATDNGQNGGQRSIAIGFLLGIITAASVFMLREIYFEDVNTRQVDNAIRQGIISADIELDNIAEHESNTRDKVVVIREKVWAEIEALSPDALTARALERAERMRGIIASDDNADTGGVFTE